MAAILRALLGIVDKSGIYNLLFFDKCLQIQLAQISEDMRPLLIFFTAQFARRQGHHKEAGGRSAVLFTPSTFLYN